VIEQKAETDARNRRSALLASLFTAMSRKSAADTENTPATLDTRRL
jgi:hypothetical protein